MFFGPVFIAMLIYFNLDVVGLIPQKTTNHGTFILPVQTLKPLDGFDENSQPLVTGLLKGKWTLLYWGEAECNLYCEAELFKLRQVPLSLGREANRVQTVYLTPHALSDSSLKKLKRFNPKLHIAKIKVNSPIAEQMQNFTFGRIYLIDTLGNLILEYNDNSTSKGIFKDIKSLLRVSKIG